MKTPADVIAALESVSGKLDKLKICKDAFKAGIFEFFEGAAMAYDPLRSFGVKVVPLIEGEDDPDFVPTFTWADFKNLVNQLENRATTRLSGNAARDALRNAADSCSAKEWNGFYRRVLLKDFKCGASERTFNKALTSLGSKAKEYIIPEFECQLAKNGNDHPKKLTGIKLLDPKLDGVRLLTFIDIVDKTVTQYTRDGRINDNFTEISSNLANLIPHLKESIVLDGEVVSQNFQQLMTQLNRKEADTADAKLALFDIIRMQDFKNGEYKVTQSKRHEQLVELIPLLQELTGDSVYVIPKLTVNLNTPEGQETFKEFNNTTVMAGFEGIMVKDPMAPYRCKRADAWLKIKPKISVDLEITGVVPGDVGTKYENTMGAILCAGEEQGKPIELSCGSGFSDDLRNEIWELYTNTPEKILGRIVEIEGDAISKSPNKETYSIRFPVFARFRGFEPGEKI